MKTSPILLVAVFLELSIFCYCQRKEEVRPSSKKAAEKSNSEAEDENQAFDDIACSPDTQPRELTDFSGWFTSPNFPANYPNNANCQWLISSQLGVVHLNFEVFNTEESFDAVKIHDGDTTSSPVITSFDGPLNPPPVGVRSSGPSMLVVFTSDDTTLRSGFNVSYTSAELDFTPDPCYALTRPLVTTDYSGTFESNGFPDRYWNYANCQWLFESREPGGTVEVQFDHFSTEPDYDIVYAYDGNSASSPVLVSLYGSYPAGSIPSIHSSGRFLFVRFLTDNVVSNYAGFNGTYTSVPAASTTAGPPLTTDFPVSTDLPTTTQPPPTTTNFPAGSCGSVLHQSPSDAAVSPNFDLMCHLNRNDTAYLDDRCRDLLQNIPGYGDADGLISQGGNFGCALTPREDFFGSENACYDEYQWQTRLSNCITCTKLLVCIRFN